MGMEVSVDQEFSPDLNDNTSTAYKDFSDTFWDQVTGKGRELKSPSLKLSLGPWVCTGHKVQVRSQGSRHFRCRRFTKMGRGSRMCRSCH